MSPKYTRPISRGPSFDDVRRNYARTVREQMEEGDDSITALDCPSSRPAMAGIPSLCIDSSPCIICRICRICFFCWWTCWAGLCQDPLCFAPDKSEKEET